MTAQARSGLYFILNPAMGIIKIGITDDLPARKKALECACGVMLDVLRFVPGAQCNEKGLHLAFSETRLCGEWFAPSEELLGLIDGGEEIGAFLSRMAPEMARRAEMARAAKLAESSEREEAVRADREEIQRLAAEKKRLEARRAETSKRLRVAKEERERAAHAAAQEAWRAKTPEVLINRLISAPRAHEAATRRATIEQQRARNAALIGVEPEGVSANA